MYIYKLEKSSIKPLYTSANFSRHVQVHGVVLKFYNDR